MKKLISILALALLVGCATTKDAIVAPPEKVIRLDPSALERCKPLLKINSGDEVLHVTLSNFAIHAECVNKQDNSIKLLKEFSNYKE